MIWGRLDHIPWVRAIAAEVEPGVLTALEADLTWFGIESGTVLFSQGDPGSDCFLLAAGRLGVLIDEGTGAQLVGSVIGVDVTAHLDFHAAEAEIESRSLAWMVGEGRGRFANLFRLMFRCATIGSGARESAGRDDGDLLIEPELTGIDMLSFKTFDAAVEAGYAATLVAVEDSGFRERLRTCSIKS